MSLKMSELHLGQTKLIYCFTFFLSLYLSRYDQAGRWKKKKRISSQLTFDLY